MSMRASFSLKRALTDGVSGLPRALGGAWLALTILWCALAFAPFVLHGVKAPYSCLIFAVVIGLLKLISLGGLYRVALFGPKARDEGLGLGGVQVGLPELRLIAASILIGLFVLLIVATLAVVFAIATNVAGINLDGMHLSPGGGVIHTTQPGHWFVVGFALASLLLLIFLIVKFTLAHAATVAEGRMVTLNALGLSSGNAGKLLIGLTVIVAPLVIAAVAAFHHLHRAFVLSPKPPALDAGTNMPMIVHAALAGLAVFVILPLSAGFLSSAYRQIVVKRKA